MAVRVANEWLATCGGCEVTVLDLGEALLNILPKLQFVHMPVLMDNKYFGQTGEKKALEIPQADVGLISGSIRNKENREIAEEMRKKCKILVAVGSCACYGGIPALGNLSTKEEIMDKVYRGSKSTESGPNPGTDIPLMEDKVSSVAEVVKCDIELPGCPTTPELIAEALTALLEGKPFKLAEKSVCDECPTKREKKSVTALKRPLESVEMKPGQPLSEVRCFMEQGFLCQGPATKCGCGGKDKTPRCVKAYMPCRGCFGPIRKGANPMVDMMNALSTAGLKLDQIPDRQATFNRFIGGGGRLRPMPGAARGGK